MGAHMILVPLALLLAAPAAADVVLASRTLRAGSVIGAGDLVLSLSADIPGAVRQIDEALGLEARVTLYAGRPIPVASLGAPALVERNATVLMIFQRSGLDIRAEGRALGRGAEGDEIRVLNLASRNTITGIVTGPGQVRVP